MRWPGQIDRIMWHTGTLDGRPMADVLRRRDFAAIFRFLATHGWSRARISAATGLTESRVREIANGKRLVTTYDVIERIAEGLNIDRGLLGLAYTTSDDHGRLPSAQVNERKSSVEAAHDLRQLRAELDATLAAATVSSAHLELIEQAVSDHILVYPRTPPTVMLGRLADECGEVKLLSQRRQPATIQARLSGAAALLATMSADALMRLGLTADARLWYRTAMAAADDSGELGLRVLVRAQAAMLPYYFANPEQTVALADTALALSTEPCAATALAQSARARALAKLGAEKATREAVAEARRTFDLADEPDSGAAFRFPAKRFLLYLSGAMTWLGDTARAYQVQEEALALYRSAPAALIDPALLQLDRAMCLVQDHRSEEAATTAAQAVSALPVNQRTELVLSRAGDVVEAAPPAEQRDALARLAEYVDACRAQARTLAVEPASQDP